MTYIYKYYSNLLKILLILRDVDLEIPHLHMFTFC